MGEEIVIIEELEPNWCQMAASILKTWFDQYTFSGEGSNIAKIRPLFWILTSNYSLEKLFTDKDGKLIEEDYKAIKRRLFTIQINSIYDEINWPKLELLYISIQLNIRIKIYEKFRNSFKKKKNRL